MVLDIGVCELALHLRKKGKSKSADNVCCIEELKSVKLMKD